MVNNVVTFRYLSNIIQQTTFRLLSSLHADPFALINFVAMHKPVRRNSKSSSFIGWFVTSRSCRLKKPCSILSKRRDALQLTASWVKRQYFNVIVFGTMNNRKLFHAKKPVSVIEKWDRNQSIYSGRFRNCYLGVKNIIYQTCNTWESVYLSSFSSLHLDCGSVQNNTLTSPGYPSPYPNNMDCVYRVPIPFDKELLVLFNYFSVEDKSNCT